MFNNLAFHWPAQLDTVASDSDSALANAPAELTAAGARLTAAPALSVVGNPVAASCSGSAELLQQLREALLARVAVVVVHPWVQGVGQGDNHHRYLSPENAVIAAANKLGDTADNNKPGTVMDAIAVLLTGTGFNVFSQTIKQFNTVFPLPETLMCERRALQLSTVDQDKQILPDAAINSRWLPRTVAGVGAVAQGSAVVGELCAIAGGYEAGGVAADAELQALISKKSASITAAQSAIDSMAAAFTGGVGRGDFFSSQTPQQIKSTLLSSHVGHDEPLACCVVFSGAPGSLQMVKEMLGL